MTFDSRSRSAGRLAPAGGNFAEQNDSSAVRGPERQRKWRTIGRCSIAKARALRPSRISLA